MKNSKTLIMKITESRRLLQNQYAFLNGDGDFDAFIVNRGDRYRTMQNSYASLNGVDDSDESIINRDKGNLQNTAQRLNHSSSKLKRYSRIERIARGLQLDIWKKRHQFWPDGIPSDLVELLDPSIAAECIGFKFEEVEFLGELRCVGEDKEIAGVIDRLQKRISISRRLPKNTGRFTAAHELGHALLHQETVMHRDRPIDGLFQTNGSREPIEIDADKFATYFLMPEKLVRARFQKIFGANIFELNDYTAFALNPTNPGDLFNRDRTIRDLARILASTEQYNGQHMHSLANQFSVSVEAMAIRLEELRVTDV